MKNICHILQSIALFMASITLFAPRTAAQYYQPDILGERFEQHTFQMGDSFDGEAVSTLVRALPMHDTRRSILYIHGYNDYFFQREMALRFNDSLYNFYALDLRRYGRSLRSHQIHCDVRDLSEYFADIDSALLTMQREGAQEIILMGHSTGGLITSLYSMQPSSERQEIEALILNSPFLDMNMGWFMEQIITPIASIYGAIFPKTNISQGDDRTLSPYGQSLLREYHGEWEFDTSLKRLRSEPLTMGWVRAIHKGHSALQRNRKQISIPILLLYSDKSIWESEWSEAFASADAVLDVRDISKYGAQLGSQVHSVEIKDGIHDLMLSRPEVREELYPTIFNWLNTEL